MAERNADVPEDRRIEFRIGINVGDIIIDEGDIYGDGVNIAARLETLADPAGSAFPTTPISRSRASSRSTSATWASSSSRTSRSRCGSISVADLAGRSRPADARPRSALPDKPSIAVLPFQNMSGDPEQEYFADGMVEDIITGAVAHQVAVRHRAQFDLHLQGQGRRREASRPRARRALCAGRQRAQGRQPRAHHRAADRCRNRQRISGPTASTATSTIFSPCRTRSRYPSSARSNRACALPRSSVSNANGQITSTPMISSLQAQPDVYSRMPERIEEGACASGTRTRAGSDLCAGARVTPRSAHHSLFLRGGLREENRTASIRHAEAAIAHGQDDALAFTFAGFTIGMDKHDTAAAFAAFEAALAVSPSLALTYILGSVILAFSGEADRAIEWANRGLRLSPFDPWRFTAFVSSSLGHFHAANTKRRPPTAARPYNPIQASHGATWC